jgi:hypothetical protein
VGVPPPTMAISAAAVAVVEIFQAVVVEIEIPKKS